MLNNEEEKFGAGFFAAMSEAIHRQAMEGIEKKKINCKFSNSFSKSQAEDRVFTGRLIEKSEIENNNQYFAVGHHHQHQAYMGWALEHGAGWVSTSDFDNSAPPRDGDQLLLDI